MHLYLLRKSFLFLITLLLLTLISFSLFRLNAEPSLREPFSFLNWFGYLDKLLQGNFGIAYDGQSVMTHLARVFPATIELCLFAFLITILLGIPFGILAGITRGSHLDRSIYTVTLIISSIPIFGLSVLFIMLFSIYFGEFPTSGRYNLLIEIPTVTGFAFIDIFLTKMPNRDLALYNIFRHLLLPGLVLAIAPTAEIIKLLRDSVAHVMTQNYVKAAATKGLSKFAIIRHHVLKNALAPVLPKFGLQLSTLMSLVIITESVFNWPGIGAWLLTSVELHDYASVQAGVLVIGMTVLSLSMLFDLLSMAMSPLMRREWNAITQ